MGMGEFFRILKLKMAGENENEEEIRSLRLEIENQILKKENEKLKKTIESHKKQIKGSCSGCINEGKCERIEYISLCSRFKSRLNCDVEEQSNEDRK